jgi:hypothetical protein
VRACPRRFMLLAQGGVRISWGCGAVKDVANETGAVDMDILAERFADVDHHHRHHLHHDSRP